MAKVYGGSRRLVFHLCFARSSCETIVADRKLNNRLVNASWKITGPFARPTVKCVAVLVFFFFSFFFLYTMMSIGEQSISFFLVVFFCMFSVFFFFEMQCILRSISITFE